MKITIGFSLIKFKTILLSNCLMWSNTIQKNFETCELSWNFLRKTGFNRSIQYYSSNVFFSCSVKILSRRAFVKGWTSRKSCLRNMICKSTTTYNICINCSESVSWKLSVKTFLARLNLIYSSLLKSPTKSK